MQTLKGAKIKMSYKNENKPKTRHYGLMTVVIFCCLLIYILGYLAVFVSKPSIGVETVEYGALDLETNT